MKMEGCRKKLLQRRETLRQKRLSSIQEAQTEQNSQTEEIESQNETLDRTPVQNNLISTDETADNCIQSSSGSALFATNNEGGIPGLDLVESRAPKADLNIVAQVNNILGNPEIQSLLSNIQKQQNETEQSKLHSTGNPNESDLKSTSNTFTQPSSYQINKDQTPQPSNPFPLDNQDDRDERDMSQPNNSKRGRYWNENPVSTNESLYIFDRDRTNFPQQVYLFTYFYNTYFEDIFFKKSFFSSNRQIRILDPIVSSKIVSEHEN